MTATSIRTLVDAINDPASMAALSLPQWDLLIRQARNADVLGKIGITSQNRGLLEQFPEQPRRHLASAALVAQRQMREVHTETRMIDAAMARADCDFVLLKGAAYALAGLQAGQGRMMSDIDVLVPKDDMPSVESALMFHGWSSTVKSAYDQRYYRQWMHEIPPMRHIHRATTIDVHHAILPLTARAHPSSARLLADSRPVKPGGRMRVLSPVDMLLHSATHLFHEGELEQGFRGLADIDSLLRELGAQPGFWQSIVARSVELELTRPLFYALRYSQMMLNTPVPHDVQDELSRTAGARPARTTLAMMDALFTRALSPHHYSASDHWTPLARWLLYVRGHWLRMPPWLLVVHLVRKALVPKPVSQTPPA